MEKPVLNVNSGVTLGLKDALKQLADEQAVEEKEHRKAEALRRAREGKHHRTPEQINRHAEEMRRWEGRMVYINDMKYFCRRVGVLTLTVREPNKKEDIRMKRGPNIRVQTPEERLLRILDKKIHKCRSDLNHYRTLREALVEQVHDLTEVEESMCARMDKLEAFRGRVYESLKRANWID